MKNNLEPQSSNPAPKQALREADVTNPSLCKCSKVECARMNGVGEYVCGICDKKLNEKQSKEFAQSRASYYGW